MKLSKRIIAMFLVVVMVIAQVSVLPFAENTYASGLGDSASYAMKIPAGDKVAGGSITTTAWVMSSNTIGRNETDTGYASNTNGFIFTKTVNGERFFKLTPNANNAYATFINVPYNVYTSESPLLYNGIPSVINPTSIEGMTFRVKGEGLSSDTITFNISLMNKTGATVAYTASSNIKLIDFATGKVSDVTVSTGTNGGIQLPGNVDGILYVPVGGFKNGTVTLADSGKLAEFATTATSRANTNLGFKGIRYQFKGTAFNGKTLLVGDAMFVDDFDTYKLYHTAPAAPTADAVNITSNSIKVNAVSGVVYSLDRTDWSNITGEFTGLNAGTKYTVYAAYAQNIAIYSAAEFTTKGLADIVPLGKTYNSITVEVVAGQEYSVDGTNWNTTGIFENLDANTEYTVKTRVIGETDEKTLVVKTEKFPYNADDDNTYYALRIPDGTNALTNGFTGSITSLPVENINLQNFVVIAPSSENEGSATINAGSLTYGKNTIGLPDDMLKAGEFSGLAIRMKVVGNTGKNSVFTIVPANGQKLVDGSYKFIDANNGNVSSLTYANGFTVTGEMDGWLVIPFDSIKHATSDAVFTANANKANYKELIFTLKGADSAEFSGDWANRSLKIGASVFFIDGDRFVKDYSIPALPNVIERTTTSINFETTDGVLYSIDNGATWVTTGFFENLTPNTVYVFYAKYDGKVAQREFNLKTRQENPALIAPVAGDVTTTKDTITIATKEDHEYSIDGGNTWSEEGVFTGLSIESAYNVIARIYGTTETTAPLLVYTKGGIYSTGYGDGAIYMYQVPTTSDTETNANGEYFTKHKNNTSWWGGTFAVDPTDPTVNKDSDNNGVLFIEEINGERMIRIDTHGKCASGTISSNITYNGAKYMGGNKGITTDIVDDVNKIKGFAFRIATKGGAADQVSALDFYFNFADGSQVRQSNLVPEVTYIDAATGAVSTIEYNYGIKLTGEMNGWFIVPIEGYTTSQAKFLQNLSTDFYGVTAWPHSKTCSHGASYSNWNDKVFYLGASVFLTDIDKFISMRSAPAVPELDSKTSTSIKVKPVAGVEYSLNGVDGWTTSGSFTGLLENTEYTVYARYVGKQFASSKTWFTDMTNPPLTAPEADVVETEKITVVVIPGLEYSIDGENWNEDGIFEGLKGETEYTVYARVKGTTETVSSKIETLPYPNPYYNENDTTSMFLDIPDTPGDSKLGQAWGWANPALSPLHPEGHEKAGYSTYPGGGGSLAIREFDGEYFAEYTLYPVVKDVSGVKTTTYPDSQMTLGSKMLFGQTGVPKAINMAKQEAIAVRIKTVGMTSDMVNGFDLYINAAAGWYASGASEIYIIDKKTGVVTTQPDGGNIYFTEDVDGWLVLPMDCFYKYTVDEETGEKTYTVGPDWFQQSFSGLNVWLHGKDKSGALWADLGKYLYWGNSYFVEDLDAFFNIHSSPAKPELVKKDTTSIYVKAVEGQEYSIDGVNWNTTGIFKELTANTKYTVQTRYIGKVLASSQTWFTDMKNPPLVAPQSFTTTETTITINDITPGLEYSIDQSIWNEEGQWAGLRSETEYTIYIRVKGTEKTITTTASTIAYPNPYDNGVGDTGSFFMIAPNPAETPTIGQNWGWANGQMTTTGIGGGPVPVVEKDGEFFIEFKYQVERESYTDTQMGLTSKILYGIKGLPNAINIYNQDAIALRLKVEGMNGKPASVSFYTDTGKGNSISMNSKFPAYFIELDGTVTEMSATPTFTRDMNGWFIVPIETTLHETRQPIEWYETGFNGLTPWLHNGDSCSHGKKDSSWEGKALYVGDMMFVKDWDTFFSYHAAPNKPVLVEKTTNKITVEDDVPGFLLFSIDGGATWQKSNTFKNLKENTQYTIIKKYINCDAVSEGLTIHTDMANPPLDTPEIDYLTDSTLQVKVVPGLTYTVDGAYWTELGIFENLDPNTDYNVYGKSKTSGSLTPMLAFHTPKADNPYARDDGSSTWIDMSRFGDYYSETWFPDNMGLTKPDAEGNRKPAPNWQGGFCDVVTIENERFIKFDIHTGGTTNFTIAGHPTYGISGGFPRGIWVRDNWGFAVRIKVDENEKNPLFSLYFNCDGQKTYPSGQPYWVIDNKTGTWKKYQSKGTFDLQGVDGYLLLPFTAFQKHDGVTNATMQTMFTGIQFFLRGGEAYNNTDWADTNIYIGDSFVLEDPEKFVAIHAPNTDERFLAVAHNTVTDPNIPAVMANDCTGDGISDGLTSVSGITTNVVTLSKPNESGKAVSISAGGGTGNILFTNDALSFKEIPQELTWQVLDSVGVSMYLEVPEKFSSKVGFDFEISEGLSEYFNYNEEYFYTVSGGKAKKVYGPLEFKAGFKGVVVIPFENFSYNADYSTFVDSLLYDTDKIDYFGLYFDGDEYPALGEGSIFVDDFMLYQNLEEFVTYMLKTQGTDEFSIIDDIQTFRKDLNPDFPREMANDCTGIEIGKGIHSFEGLELKLVDRKDSEDSYIDVTIGEGSSSVMFENYAAWEDMPQEDLDRILNSTGISFDISVPEDARMIVGLDFEVLEDDSEYFLYDANTFYYVVTDEGRVIQVYGYLEFDPGFNGTVVIPYENFYFDDGWSDYVDGVLWDYDRINYFGFYFNTDYYASIGGTTVSIDNISFYTGTFDYLDALWHNVTEGKTAVIPASNAPAENTEGVFSPKTGEITLPLLAVSGLAILSAATIVFSRKKGNR